MTDEIDKDRQRLEDYMQKSTCIQNIVKFFSNKYDEQKDITELVTIFLISATKCNRCRRDMLPQIVMIVKGGLTYTFYENQRNIIAKDTHSNFTKMIKLPNLTIHPSIETMIDYSINPDKGYLMSLNLCNLCNIYIYSGSHNGDDFDLEILQTFLSIFGNDSKVFGGDRFLFTN